MMISIIFNIIVKLKVNLEDSKYFLLFCMIRTGAPPYLAFML